MANNVYMFTLNDNCKLSKNLQKNIEKQKIHEREKYNDVNNVSEEDINNENKEIYTLSDLIWGEHRFCIRCLQNTKCNNAAEHAIEQDFPLKNMLQNPSRISILNKYLEKQDLGFENQQVRFNICTFIYSNGNCKNCNEGRFKFIDINGEKIKYCYSDLNPKKIRTKLPIGLHIDLVFVEDIITKKINITKVLQLQEEELINPHKHNQYNKQYNNNDEQVNISKDFSSNINENFPDLTNNDNLQNNDNLNFSIISNKYGNNNYQNNTIESSKFHKESINSTGKYTSEKIESLYKENISLNNEIKSLKLENKYLSNSYETSKKKIADLQKLLQKNTSGNGSGSGYEFGTRSESCPGFNLGKSSSNNQNYYEDDFDDNYSGDY